MTTQDNLDLPDFLTDDAVSALNAGLHAAPFDVLGPHKSGNRRWLTTFQPDAVRVTAIVGTQKTVSPRVAGDVYCSRVAG